MSVSVPVCRFVEMIGEFLPDPNLVMDLLSERRFTISEAIRRSLNSIGSLELIHSGFEMMRLEGRLLENPDATPLIHLINPESCGKIQP